MVPTVSGSTQGFKIELMSLEPTIGVTGKAILTSTHTYTERYLEDLVSECMMIVLDGSPNEASAATRVIEIIEEITESDGSYAVDRTGATFMAPRNFSGSSLYYRLIVTSEETGDTAFSIDLTVQSEADPLGEAISTLRTVQNNELLQRMNEELASIEFPSSDSGWSYGDDESSDGEGGAEEGGGGDSGDGGE